MVILLLLQEGQVWVKTALSMNIVEHVAIHNSTPVAVFSLEMPMEQLVIRMIFIFWTNRL